MFVTTGAYFFDKPFGTAGQTWNPRDMAAGRPMEML
jgi:hypothetical protein